MRLPRVKPEHAPCRLQDGTVRIGGDIFGVAAEVRDPNGWVWAAMQLLDGTRSPQEGAARLCERFPGLDRGAATRVVDAIVVSGYAEDLADEGTGDLTADEQQRYGRNREFFRRVDLRPGVRRWEPQGALKKARVLLLGVGGTGSHVAWGLTAAGVGRLHLVDPDVVDLTNLTRQLFYTEADIGRPKAEVLTERLHAVNSAVELSCERRRVETEADLQCLVSRYDVLVLCADEPRGEIKSMATRACAAAGKPWVGGGYNGPLVTVGVYGPGGPCHDCLVAGEEARLRPGARPYIGGGAIAPSAAISGQLIAYEVISLLTGVARHAPGYMRGINLIVPDDLVYVRHPAREDCEVCRA